MRVMARRGYAQASVASIAKEAGLTSGLLHYHFKSKEEILLGLLDRLGELVLGRFEARADLVDDARGRLDAFLDAHLATGPDAHPEAVASWVALGTEAIASPAVREAYGRFMGAHHGRLTELVQQALEERGAQTARASHLAAALLAAIEGTMRVAVLAPGVIVEGTAAGLVRDMASGLLEGAR